MLLTKLEIRGFKSFGDKVVLHFDKGVTGVVGPNGSGKSNVVDAIRWVLGEQKTRSLRSEKMENIIFNGTKNRKPLQMAEAAMTFKNTKNLLPTEYSEVTISRRYYRSGEGEYLLNGVACRLKDIQDLFMDTGIGPDSYAIIELKMVDEILNDQNQSRRGLFEEAAGVSKFKKRKKETLKKLEETDADLERVADLLHEIGKNLKSLERQAKQAERYLELKAQYKELSLQLAAKAIAHHFEALQRLGRQLEQEGDRKIALQQQSATADAQIEQFKASLLQQEKLLSSRQHTLNEQVNKIRQFESEKKIRNERLRYLTDKAGSLSKQLEEDGKTAQRALFSLEGLERECEQAEKMLRETTALLEEARAAHEAEKLRTQQLKAVVEELGGQAKSRQAIVYQHRRTLEVGEVQRSSLRQELEREATDTSSRSEHLATFDLKIKELEGILSEKQTQLHALEAHQALQEQRMATAETALKQLRDELAKASRTLDAKRNEHSLTKSMLDNLEGYPQAIRFLKKHTPWGKQAPLLSDIIACDEQYRVAIENFLEPYLNYYLVDTEEQAVEAINLLSDGAKGRAHFMVLEHLRGYRAQTPLQFEQAVPAISLIDCDERYRNLASFLLHEVYVVTGRQDALPKHEGATFITQNGKIIQRPYSLSGGSVGLFAGKKLGRAKNLERLEQDMKVLEVKIEGLEATIAQQEAEQQDARRAQAKPEIEALRKSMAVQGQELVALQTKQEQFRLLLSDSENKREALLERLSEVEQQLEATRPRLQADADALQALEERLEQARFDAEDQAAVAAQRSSAYNQQNLLFHQQTNKLESLQKEIEYKRSTYERGQARTAANQADLQSTEQEIRRLQSHSDDNEQQLIGLYEEKDGIGQGVQEAEKAYYQLRGDLSEAEKRLRQLQEQRSQLDQILLQLQQEAGQARMAIAAAKERVLAEFDLDLEAYVKEMGEAAADPRGLDALREEVRQVRDRMDKMGAINHTAIEAYQEIKQRFDFITEQQEDLAKAKASLLSTIEEIDAVAKESFMEAFKQIREHFIRVFRSLFTAEDSCDLILEDPNDPLQSKIEILARPKGKRPLTINQLSGGEKTLTATALLFAIYLLKPAPFCIFDEVDAPLDDANIDKFNNIIKEFSKNSQFIIVTHNKRTMASTDVMYGITMLEQGVSTVVAVDLKDLPNG